MLGTSRLIRPVPIRAALIGVVLLLTLSACSTSDWPSSWASETAQTTCSSGYARSADSVVLEVDGETVLVIGAKWSADEDSKLGATRLSGGDVVPGLDPATGLTPDKVLCLTTRSTQTIECPDGTVIAQASTKVEATLHSLALEEDIGSTEVLSSVGCRDGASDGEVELAYTNSRSAQPDVYDIDQVLCDLLTCVIDDEVSARLSEMRAPDPRSEVCDFNEPFIDGVIELEDGPVYVAHQLGFREVLSEATPALDTATERTLCLASGAGADAISCGEYRFEGESFGGVAVSQRGVSVTGRWFEGDSSEHAAQTSTNYYSDCTEQISVMTTTYGSSSVGIRDMDDRVTYSTLTPEHLVWIAEDLQQWAAVNAEASDLSSTDCTAISQLESLSTLMRRLDTYDDDLDRWTEGAPDGLDQDIDSLQSRTSDLFDAIGDDSPLFDPVFELWYVAHFNWPVINTFADPGDPEATEDDFALTLMGMPARVGLVSVLEPAFTTRHETLSHLQQLHTDHC